MILREKVFIIIEKSDGDNKPSKIFDEAILLLILATIVVIV